MTSGALGPGDRVGPHEEECIGVKFELLAA